MNMATSQSDGLMLYNTLARGKVALETIEPGKVGLYCCGPTVYNYAHIGNMRTYIFEDLLRRGLEFFGYKVKHVMNITDVGHLTSDADEGEDKMILAMRREGKSAHEIADFYSQAFFRHSRMLNIKRPQVVCKATDHIDDMIVLIRRLEACNLAYTAAGNVYFDIRAFENYGALRRQSVDELKAGARTDIDRAKRHPGDFALWFTKSKFENREMVWDSPWGRGYPGWAIECSAMSMKYLGEQFDMHCGGREHIAIHHTNEIAQSEGATGKSPYVRVWLHAEWLHADNEKMSKSSGRFSTVDSLLESGYDPLAFRYLCLGAHYRQPLAFSYEALDGAANALGRLRRTTLELKRRTKPATLGPDHPRLVEFRNFLGDDLNVPRALSIAWNTVRDQGEESEKLALLYEFDKVLGLDLEALEPVEEEIPQNITNLVAKRDEARKAGNWGEADSLRDEISTAGYIVKDTSEGPVVTRR